MHLATIKSVSVARVNDPIAECVTAVGLCACARSNISQSRQCPRQCARGVARAGDIQNSFIHSYIHSFIHSVLARAINHRNTKRRSTVDGRRSTRDSRTYGDDIVVLTPPSRRVRHRGKGRGKARARATEGTFSRATALEAATKNDDKESERRRREQFGRPIWAAEIRIVLQIVGEKAGGKITMSENSRLTDESD